MEKEDLLLSLDKLDTLSTAPIPVRQKIKMFERKRVGVLAGHKESLNDLLSISLKQLLAWVG